MYSHFPGQGGGVGYTKLAVLHFYVVFCPREVDRVVIKGLKEIQKYL